MDKNLESLRLEYGNRSIQVAVRGTNYNESLKSNQITFLSKPRVVAQGKKVTVYNLPKTCTAIEVYVGGEIKETVEYAGNVDLTGTKEIDMTAHFTDAQEYQVYLKVVCGATKTQTETLTMAPSAYDPVFANNTWADIVSAANKGAIPEEWSVGDEKDIELETGETITMQIIGFNHDDLADGSGKAPITLLMKNSLATTYNMNASDTNSTSWRDSAMRGRMSTFLGYLPTELQTGIKEVKKKTATSGSNSTLIETADKLFLLSPVEVMGTNMYNASTQISYTGEGEQYDYFKNAQIPEGFTPVVSGATTGTFVCAGKNYTNRFGETKSTQGYVNWNNAKGLGNSATSARGWWLRSPHCNDSNYVCYVNTNGNASNYGASNTYGLAFGFCI